MSRARDKSKDIDSITIYSEEQITKFTKDKSNLVNKGTTCEIYKGAFDSKDLAIKYIDKPDHFAEWENEKNCLLAVPHHSNIVSIKGYAIGGNFRAIILEYLPENLETVYLGLDWKQTLKVIQQLVGALIHVHKHTEYAVIDIKPSNILLDKEQNVKLSDFGYAIKGARIAQGYTKGYCAPEVENYKGNTTPSKKSGIYTFGIVALQLLMREVGEKQRQHRPTRRKEDNTHIAQKAEELKSKKGHIVHKNFHNCQRFSEKTAIDVTNIIIGCIQTHPNSRPDMSVVYNQIKALK